MGVLDYVWMGILAVFQGPPMFSIFGVPISIALGMVLFGSVTGIVVGAMPGLGSTIAMAISLPILISIFGYTPDALLPVMGFLVGVMKGGNDWRCRAGHPIQYPWHRRCLYDDFRRLPHGASW